MFPQQHFCKTYLSPFWKGEKNLPKNGMKAVSFLRIGFLVCWFYACTVMHATNLSIIQYSRCVTVIKNLLYLKNILATILVKVQSNLI